MSRARGPGMRAGYGPASTEQALGALPVVAWFCRRLEIAASPAGPPRART